ncbi:MAG: DUF1109 domain-containing protein [Alphaproteobacteria bacterium]|nr:DUF1109 domain-containing protein [Alphaproteobacteria bacterium]MDE2162365.1 DUF1109 domain-containing protein [Alphaproteobacteria bacterium]MDE2265519.1 DUF1109 domain-containing protein [Alphaproteobacteria bacterium]MDE2498709.1 DUF1109 domain-containing protein [Alphaproteobacteria bacterium]
MKTDALIEQLAERAEPVAPGAMLRTLAIGLGGGAIVSALLMQEWLGVRHHMLAVFATPIFWAKFFYTLLFALVALAALERLARPGAKATARLAAMTLPFVVMALLAAWSWRFTPASDQYIMLFGSSYDLCPYHVVVLALPIFIGVFWALRKLAPTRPVLAGATGGLVAGALGAFIYAFHCPEPGMPFLAIWYTLGIILVGAFGAVLGRFSLRW